MKDKHTIEEFIKFLDILFSVCDDDEIKENNDNNNEEETKDNGDI